MKFLCDNCKAKYQIGDEKVAGKTVRMKCRRCGHSITVSSKVTESSVSMQLPTDPSQAKAEAPPESHREPISRPSSQPARPAARAPMPSTGDDESTMVMASPIRPDMARSAPVRAAPTRPGVGPPPRPAAGAPGPRAVPSPRPVTALRSPAPAASPARDLRPGPYAAAPAPQPVPVAPPADQGGVAAAFQRAVSETPASPSRVPPPPEDWFVGVGGVPLGPVRVDVIREKAQSGQVDGDTLVWREGFDEWQPLKKFPELLEVVRTAQSSRHAAYGSPKTVPMAAAAEPAPQAATPHGPGWERTSSVAAVAALAAPAPQTFARGGGDVAQFNAMGSQPSVGPEPFSPKASGGTNGAVSVLADPFAAPARPFGAPLPEPPAARKPAPVEGPSRTSIAAPSSTTDLDLVVPRRRSMHPAAWALIAMAAVFGGVAAYFVFFNPNQAPQTKIVIVERAVPATGAATGAAPTASAPESEPTAEPTASQRAQAPKNPIATGPRTKASAAPAVTPPPAAPIDTSGFTGGPKGPSASGPSGAGPGGSGSQLSQGEISAVVSANQARVRRSCWEPALAGRAANGPTNARVNAQLTISPSGNVDSVNASGADAFPGLASCIATRMRSWKFPASGSSTTVNVPFVFAGQ
jgi:predicted Zn finger-like uncharacterized protein